MATLFQDVWLGASPRVRARRLGPFREARVRAVLFPEPGVLLDEPRVHDFLDRLAERVEVVVSEIGGNGAEALAAPLVEEVERRWGGGDTPLLAIGLGRGAALALDAARLGCVKAVVALGLGESARFLEVTELGAASGVTDKPLLVAVSRTAAPAHFNEIQDAVARWRHGWLVALAAGDESLWRAPWPGIVAEWALAVSN
jgi:hypothetical protein